MEGVQSGVSIYKMDVPLSSTDTKSAKEDEGEKVNYYSRWGLIKAYT